MVAALQSIGVHEPNELQVPTAHTHSAAHATHDAWAPLWQARGLPRLLRGEDTLCCAQTGSGKTLLFLLPILRHLLGPPPSREPRVVLSRKFDESRPKKPKRGHIPKTVLPSAPDALVLVHSRELALQIAHVARALAAALPGRADERVCCLTNGAPYTPQRTQLRGGGVRLLVATPSRLLYHVGEDNVSLHGLRVLAADEADALLCQRGGPLAGEARQVPARQGGMHAPCTHAPCTHAPCTHAPCTRHATRRAARCLAARCPPVMAGARGGVAGDAAREGAAADHPDLRDGLAGGRGGAARARAAREAAEPRGRARAHAGAALRARALQPHPP